MAASAPDRLYAFALEQMRLGLIPNSRAAYALSRPSRSPGIDLADLHYLWRVLRSACEGGRLMLSAIERDLLQAIDAMAEPRHHHSGWNTLIGSLQLRPDVTRATGRTAWLQASDEAFLEKSHRAA